MRAEIWALWFVSAKVFWAASLFALVGCSHSVPKEAPRSTAQPGQNDYLFVWSSPVQFPVNLPITQSATCRFKKSLAVGFQKAVADDKPHPPQRITYSASDEDEANTVTFIDLDTRSPKVRSNGGQAPLSVLYSDKETLILVHTSLDPEVSGGAAEMYTVFRNEGVVTHSTQKDSPLIGPFGVIEMGYCN